MVTDYNKYYEFDYDAQSLFDNDGDNGNYYNYEEQMDFIIDKIEKYGCKYDIDDIEEFLFETEPTLLSEWYLDLQEWIYKQKTQ